jgi:uncharacterized Fe-S center protein
MTNKGRKTPVYFLPWDKKDKIDRLIDGSGAMAIYEKNDFVAIKMHFGERGGDGHIKPEFVKPFIKGLKEKKTRPYLTDTNTIYHGPRNNAVEHLAVAAEHGFSQNRMQVPVIIADGLAGDDHVNIEIHGRHFRTVKIAPGIRRADKILVLSHFKGHLLVGLGGAIKNLGMGCGSRAGKFEMHCTVSPTTDDRKCVGCESCIPKCAHGALSIVDSKISLDKSICKGCGDCVIACPTGALSITWSEGAKAVQERLAEYALGAVKGISAFYFNFLNHITPNCDCMGMKETPLTEDIGILASGDPVAIDRASYDLVIKTAGDVFAKAHPGIDPTIQIRYAEELGLGSQAYDLITL